MEVEIRIYKRYDLDLMALHDAGYPISDFMKKAVLGYAHNAPVHFLIKETIDFNSSDRESFRTRFTIPNTDTETIKLLKSIKRNYRNSFCKMILRDALIFQNLPAFLTDKSLFGLHENRLEMLNTSNIPNLYIFSADEAKNRKRNKTKKILEQIDNELSSQTSQLNKTDQVLDVLEKKEQNVFEQNENANVSQAQMSAMQFSPEQMQMFQQMMLSMMNNGANMTIPSFNANVSTNDYMTPISSSDKFNSENKGDTSSEILNAVDNDDIMDMFENLMQ